MSFSLADIISSYFDLSSSASFLWVCLRWCFASLMARYLGQDMSFGGVSLLPFYKPKSYQINKQTQVEQHFDRRSHRSQAMKLCRKPKYPKSFDGIKIESCDYQKQCLHVSEWNGCDEFEMVDQFVMAFMGMRRNC